jgi:hypothetical protein
LSCRTALWSRSRRSKSCFTYRPRSACSRDHRDWQRGARKTRSFFARTFVVSTGNPLHRRGARVPHRRSDRNTRVGGSPLARLALAIVCAAADFCTTFVPRLGTALVALEVRREAAADARTKVMWRVVVRRSSGTLLEFSGLLIPIPLPQSTVHSSVIGFLLAVCAATLCARNTETESQRNPKPTAAPRLSSGTGIRFEVYRGRSWSRLTFLKWRIAFGRRKAASCSLRNLLFALASTQFFLFRQHEWRRRMRSPTKSS